MAELTINCKPYIGDIAPLCYFLSKHSTIVCFQVNSSGLKNNFYVTCKEP